MRIKNIILTAVVVMISAGVLIAGSRPKPGAVEQNTFEPAAEASKIKITFVELGSVRCVPCKMMMPVMKEIEEKYSKDVKVVFYDVWTDAGRPYAEKYGIRGIPTQVFLDADGKEFFRHVGFFPLEQILPVLKDKGVNVN